MSSVEIVETFITALQAGDLETAAGCAADAFIERGFTPRTLDRQTFLALQSELNAAMPDFSYNLSSPRELRAGVVEGQISVSGTQTGDLSLPMFQVETIPATGLAVRLPQVRVEFRLSGEKIVEMRSEAPAGGGLAGLLQQIGGELPLLPRLDEPGPPVE